MTAVKVAILGFGTVGEGVYQTIQSHAEELTAAIGKKVEVAAVLIKNKKKQRDIEKDILITNDFEEILRLPQLDVIVEAIVGREPAYTYLNKAIQRGCHIITANKEMFAHHGKELFELAKKNHVSIGFEATVAGGIPVIQTLRQLLKINRINQIQGILNGTSNFILTEMREEKLSFTEALQLAQDKGYAELDPTNDVEGFDAFYKTMILCRIAFGEEPNWQEVDRDGITMITRELIEAADKANLRFKHIANICIKEGQLQASVKPLLVGNEHPFYHVEGVENAVNVYSDIVGRITLQGPGAGMYPTASAIIEDLTFVCENLSVNRSIKQTIEAKIPDEPADEAGYWLIHGITEAGTYPAITWVEQLADEIYIIYATKDVVEEFTNVHNAKGYFSILGEYETTADNMDTVFA